MIRRRTHATCHGYTWGRKSLTFREATLTGVKPDTIIKRTNNRYVWPDKTQLWRGPDIYTGHLAAGLVDSNTGSSTSKVLRGLRNERISVGPSKVLQGSLRNEPISLGTGKVLQNLRKHSSSSLGASTMRSEIYSRQD
ncbi:hypothetical protein E4U12_007310 [Claviceps purpurea]|nr:hypothetical protein E4U12_007310 [Claviceps purpurea]